MVIKINTELRKREHNNVLVKVGYEVIEKRAQMKTHEARWAGAVC